MRMLLVVEAFVRKDVELGEFLARRIPNAPRSLAVLRSEEVAVDGVAQEIESAAHDVHFGFRSKPLTEPLDQGELRRRKRDARLGIRFHTFLVPWRTKRGQALLSAPAAAEPTLGGARARRPWAEDAGGSAPCAVGAAHEERPFRASGLSLWSVS
jgi:hypothetical protein